MRMSRSDHMITRFEFCTDVMIYSETQLVFAHWHRCAGGCLYETARHRAQAEISAYCIMCKGP